MDGKAITERAPIGDEALADTVKEHVRGRLAHYKRPRWIEFVDDLPKTTTGKVQRFRLRDGAA